MKKKTLKPVVAFDVDCHPDYKWRFAVNIFKNHADYDQYRIQCGLNRPSRACCFPVQLWDFKGPDKSKRISPVIGEMCFYVKDYRVGIVSHECVHAGLVFMRKIRKPLSCATEELYAFAVGEMVRQAVNGYWEFKKQARVNNQSQ